MYRAADVWVRGWSGEWFFTTLYGALNADGDFVDQHGIWIARKSDNAGHPAFTA